MRISTHKHTQAHHRLVFTPLLGNTLLVSSHAYTRSLYELQKVVDPVPTLASHWQFMASRVCLIASKSFNK